MNNSQDTEDLVAKLLSEMRDNILCSFLQFVFCEVGNEYFKSPGARGQHHAYEGGLAFHSASAAQLGSNIADHYNSIGIKVNRDLVVAGILIHDIGKIYCYEKTDSSREKETISGGYTHTQDGLMLHHIPMGYGLVLSLAEKFNGSRKKDDHRIDAKKIRKLLHIILSHHGRRMWSSPVIPKFTEAYIVHAVEMMDGYIEKFSQGKPIDTIYDGTNY